MPSKLSEIRRRRAEDPVFRERQNEYTRQHRARVAADPEKLAALRAYKREWAKKHRATAKGKRLQRNSVMLHRYGLTAEAYEALWFSQGGCCAACSQKTAMVIDHDHETGRVRGLLCTGCNVSLGLMRDDPDRLEALARYVRKQV